MSFQVQRIYSCDVCGATLTTVGNISSPDGWLRLDHLDYCPAHRLTVVYLRGRLVSIQIEEVGSITPT